MLDTNWKTWLLIVIVAVGGMFELFKHLPSRTAMPWNADTTPFAANNKPYSVKPMFLRPHMAAQRLPRPTQMDPELKSKVEQFIAANQPTQTDFTQAPDKGAEAKVKKKKKDEQCQEFVDPTTGKKMRRCKKKSVAKEEPKQEPAKPDPKTADHKDADLQASLDDAILAGGVGPVQAHDADVFADLQEWQRRLLTHPDLKMTQLFIQQYQQGLVSADIFYKITQLMVADSRLEMRQLGVMCAGTNISYLSFQILAGVAKNERQGSALRNSCDEALNHYAELANVSILKKIMGSNGDTFTTMTALQKFDLSMQRNLVAKPAAQPTGQVATPANASTFQQFLTVLQTLTAARDVGVNDEARRSLADLKDRLGTTPHTTPGTPPPGGPGTTASNNGP